MSKEINPYSSKYLNDETKPFPVEDEDFFSDYEDLEAEKATGTVMSSSFEMDAQKSGADQLRSRLHSIETMAQYNQLSDERKKELQLKIAQLEQRINFAQNLGEAGRDAELLKVQGEIAALETSATQPATEGEGEADVDLENDPAALKKKVSELDSQLEKLFSKGWMTEDLHTQLREKLDRMKDAAGDKDLLESAAGMASSFEDSLNEIKLTFVQKGKPVDSVGDQPAETENGTLAALMSLTNKNEQQVMMAFKQAFPDLSGKIDDIDALKKAIKNEEAPFAAPPSAGVIQFLKALDPEFGQAVGSANQWKHDIIGPAYQKAAVRLTSLLQALYGDDHIIYPSQADTTNGYQDWRQLNDISFDGTTYSFTKENKGQTNNVAWDQGSSTGIPNVFFGGGGGGSSGLGGLPGKAKGTADTVVEGAEDLAGGAKKKVEDFLGF